jgi:hypothetical protein
MALREQARQTFWRGERRELLVIMWKLARQLIEFDIHDGDPCFGVSGVGVSNASRQLERLL